MATRTEIDAAAEEARRAALREAIVAALGAEPAETGLTVPSRDAPSGWMPPRTKP